jgi:outer membrane protein OmpA-like peptidoglycan-associated protein
MRTTRALCLSLLSAAGISLLPATSLAQNNQSAQAGEFTVQNFAPAPGTKNYLGVETLRMDGNWGFSVGLFFNYAKNPFVVLSCRSESDCADKNATNKTDTRVVSDMMTWDLLAAVSPIKRLQIGLRLPVSYVKGDGLDVQTGQPLQGGIAKLGVGDPMLEGKVRIFGGAQDPFLLGAALDVSFPVGHQFSDGANNKEFYLGNSSPVTVGLRGIFDGQAGPLQFGLNLRGVFREKATLGTTDVGPVDFRYGVGLGFRISPIFRVLAEGYGSTQFTAKNGTNTLETDGAVEITPLNGMLSIKAGGGAGILQGVGVPAGRAFLGITYAHEVMDTDGDGIADNDDKCPTIAEDKDGFEDDDGCPDPDNDGDKIADEKDKCPMKPETINGFEDQDGCPDEVADRDKDGIPDADDKCPDAGGKDIIRVRGPHYGCPDGDHDGIPDHLDKCPTAAEDTDGFEDMDGCPDPDNDGDKIPDEADECVDQPETYNGYKDQDGCPDEVPNQGPSPKVQVSDTEIKIMDRVEFATGRDKIQGQKSFQVLDVVAAVLKARKEIELVEVGGHTDNVGSAFGNRKLSQKRAEAVVKYLASKGVDKHRLVAKGYGPDKPIADNKTAEGKQKNRRVEFLILKPAPKSSAASPAPPAAPAKKK